jgi:hypothetical protein
MRMQCMHHAYMFFARTRVPACMMQRTPQPHSSPARQSTINGQQSQHEPMHNRTPRLRAPFWSTWQRAEPWSVHPKVTTASLHPTCCINEEGVGGGNSLRFVPRNPVERIRLQASASFTAEKSILERTWRGSTLSSPRLRSATSLSVRLSSCAAHSPHAPE